MAKKITPLKKAAPEASPESDIDVLHPDRTVLLQSRKVLVREYRHVEWLQMHAVVAPLVAAMAAQMQSGKLMTYEQALDVIAQHHAQLLPMVAQSAGVDMAFIEGLNPDEGELLLMTWWGVNGRFFIQRAMNRVLVAREEQRRLAGGASTQPSAPTGTPSTDSAATPPAS